MSAHSSTLPEVLAVRTKDLPQEIADAIIDHLYDDPETLKNCSLVCKSWELSSAHHIFPSWSWPPSHNFSATDTSLSRCFELLSSSPRIRSSIRRFRIRQSLEPDPQTSSAPRNSRRLLLRILDLLPSLRVFHCSQLQVHRSKRDGVRASEAGKRHLEELYVSESGHYSLSVAALLGLFESVDKLVVEGGLGRTAPSPPPKPHRTAVRALEVRGLWGDHPLEVTVLNMLQARLDFAALERVEFTNSRINRAPSAFFESATRLWAIAYTAEFSPSYIPPEARALRSLTIYGVLLPDHEIAERFQQWQYVLRDISVLSHPDLEELSITLLLCEQHCWPAYGPLLEDEPFTMLRDLFTVTDWSPLNDVMQRCPRLRNLSIVITLRQRLYRGEFLAKDPARTRQVVWDVAAERLEAGPRGIFDVRFDPNPEITGGW